MARLDIRTGATGYRDQLDRTRRFLGRVLADCAAGYVIDYQDDVWSFFQNCWHVKDWVKNDPLVPQDAKDRVKAAAEASAVLAVCNDMASGTKHLKLHRPVAGAAHSHLTLSTGGDPRSPIECMIETSSGLRPAREVAAECVQEWVRILSAEGLATEELDRA
jgi:hypothetical protein